MAWAPPLTLQTLALVDTAALWHALPLAAPAILVSVIALLLNTSSLGLLTRRDIQLDQELKVSGMANLISGLAGGLIGYQAMSLSPVCRPTDASVSLRSATRTRSPELSQHRQSERPIVATAPFLLEQRPLRSR